MKRIAPFLIALCFTCYSYAQSSSMVALKIVIDDIVEPFPIEGKAQLENKIRNILTKNGVQSSDWQHQFFITTNVVPQTKDIIPGPPPQIAENMDITFYIGDAYNKVIFSSMTLSVQGVGSTSAKCYLNALANINANSSKFATFIQEGRDKIIKYYNEQGQSIMIKAEKLAKMQEFEQAIWLLTTIPYECTHFAKASELTTTIYKQFLQYQCQQNLASAKSAWNSNYNKEGAQEAAYYLSFIISDTNCYDEANALYQEMKDHLKEEWTFEMKKHEDEVSLQKDLIEAARAVGVAYGEGQKGHDTHIGFIH